MCEPRTRRCMFDKLLLPLFPLPEHFAAPTRHDGESQRCRNTSTDHTPTSPAERGRIEQAGGEVVFNGCYRVQHEDVRFCDVDVASPL